MERSSYAEMVRTSEETGMESAAASELEAGSEELSARMDLWAAAGPGCWDEEA